MLITSHQNVLRAMNQCSRFFKGRSPTMRHVSRTHRVAFDWLLDRIDLDPKNQIKYVDAKNQLADVLTKGSFTRDEWNHLLRLFNVMDISKLSSSHFSSISSPQTMSKRLVQDEKPGEDERVVAKLKPMLNLLSKSINWSPTALSSSTSQSWGYLQQQIQVRI